MTVALVASAFFGGNTEKARSFLPEYGYMKSMLSKSRLNRRLHAIDADLWQALFGVLAARSSRSATMMELTWWTPCQWPFATTSAFAAADSILWRPRARASAVISRANAAISTASGCIWL